MGRGPERVSCHTPLPSPPRAPAPAQGTTGFLPAAAFPERPLGPGALLDVAVTSKKAGGRITVDARSEAVAAAKTEEWIGLHIGEAAAMGRGDWSFAGRRSWGSLRRPAWCS